MSDIYRFLIPEGVRVLELGCGQGDLLAELRPKEGLGIDFSENAVTTARERHPELEFVVGDAHDPVDGEYDFVVLSDLINDVWDVQTVLESALTACRADTRLVANFFNRGWQIPIGLARRLGLAHPILKQNWLSITDVRNLLELAGFEVVSVSGEILWPVRTPIVDALLNRYLVKIWPFNHLGLTHFVVARTSSGRRSHRLGGGAGAQRGGAYQGDHRAGPQDGLEDRAHLRRGEFQ
jgi:SAM-dependent methyltransferase